MSSINDYPTSRIFNMFSSQPGTREYFQSHVDECIATIEKGKEKVANQVKPITQGGYANIEPGNYPDLITGQPISNFHPFFPDKEAVGGQIKEVTYDALMAPHSVPYPDITTGTPVDKFKFVTNPPAVGKNLNVSI
ncbi:hypothetical protein ACT8ZR_04865 [Neobacillus sp. M.A.Huq-85]